MKLTKPELDELRKLNPPDDPRMFRRFIDTIDSLEAELAAVRTEFREALAVRDREIAMLYDNQNAARDREKAAIAAALRQAAALVVHHVNDQYGVGLKDAILALITPDQSAARGGAPQDEGQSPNGNPPAPERGARTGR